MCQLFLKGKYLDENCIDKTSEFHKCVLWTNATKSYCVEYSFRTLE